MLAHSCRNHYCSFKIQITLKFNTVLAKLEMLDTNFAVKFIIAIHLTSFQSYHSVQVQLNSYYLVSELFAGYPAPPELDNLAA